ncbi:MAG: hypothetical protein AAF236_17330 [Verrucomicrobiota bacterium]
MFSNKQFIEASRDFVCVRLETYENAEHEALIRELLNGRYANTAFVVLEPDGETQLTRPGRSAKSLGATGRGAEAEAESVEDTLAAMEEIVGEYRERGERSDMLLQDFHSFRQALNVASGDQRLLVFVTGSKSELENIRTVLRPIFAHEKAIGIFHLDFVSSESDADWDDPIEGSTSESGVHIIRADAFGQSGEVMEALPLTSPPHVIAQALLAANNEFAGVEERKSYSDHVQEGRRKGIHFETEIPFGEDRDGDGEIDNPGRSGKGKGKGKKE